MVTLRDIAKAANVSVATVSRVLNNKSLGQIPISNRTREKVLRAARELNYYPNVSAQRLSMQRSNVIGVVIEEYIVFSASVNANILQGIGRCLTEKGYSLEMISSTIHPQIEEHLERMVIGKQLDGLIIWTNRISADFCEFLHRRGVPHCHVQSYAENTQCTAVHSDNVNGGYKATKYLIEKGHRQIMIIIDPQHIESNYRLEGYKQALKESSIQFNPEFVVKGCFGPDVESSVIDPEEFEKAASLCTAVFATSDYLAISARRLLHSQGFDLKAIIGFDGSEIAKHLTPKLPTIHQDGYRIGYLAATNVEAQLAGRPLKEKVTLIPVSLVL